MLSSGGVSKELIELLNGFLLARMQKNISECSATLDLFELDLMNGRASVYKCGAAPSYIYRRGRLFKMRSQSMPIGILNEVDLKKFELELSRGDVIVIVSDGVTGEGSECPWLFDLLAQNLPNRSLERTAELIVKYATAKGTGDDITVILVRVE
jgi:stage II sporulation protein E